MRYTVRVVEQSDGGAVIHTPTAFIRLDIAELSQLRSLFETESPTRLGFVIPAVTNLHIPDAPAVASIGLWVMVGTVNGEPVTVLRAPGTPLLPLSPADVDALITALTTAQVAAKDGTER